jgi:pimeloyl-ACP methyl ester carboxylesterase
VALAHDRSGAGPPLVLVHGLGSRRGVWDPIVERLAREREVIALDLPGFGDSPPLAGGKVPTVVALTEAVADFVGELGLERPAVAGNSLGGGIALELARRGVVSAAAALSPVGFWTPRELRYADATLWLNRRVARSIAPIVPALAKPLALRRVLIAQNFQRPERRDPADVVADVRGLANAPSFDATRVAMRSYRFARGEEIEVPVTVAWAEHDRLLLTRQSERAQRAIPQARHLILHGCGHVPTSDDPAQVAEVVLEATAGEPAAGKL